MSRARIPDWMLERLAAGDLPEAEAEALHERLAGEPDGPARLEAIRASNEAILAAHPPARVVASIRQRADGVPAARPLLRLAPALLAPALAAASVFVILERPAPSPAPEVVRLKGIAPRLAVFREAAGGAERLEDGAVAHPADRIQLGYQAAGRAYGAVVSVDGAGGVFLHLPERGARAAALEPGGLVTLPSSWELDDAPGFERFFLVVATEPFALDPVLEAARWVAARRDPARDELPLPPSFEQASFLLEKRP